MLVIFGVSVRDHLLATLVFVCERCGQQGAHHLVERARRLSLFFIPLVPLGAKYLDTCTVCGRTLEVPKDQARRAAASGTVDFR
ncbi:MAG: zinc-ribbon domain-containing protein [Actinomycetes bacterium]